MISLRCWFKSTFFVLAASLTLLSNAHAATKIELWYGYKDFFAPVFEKTIGEFNKSQNQYEVVWKGYDDYPTTMQAVVAGYRAQTHPALAMIYDVGTATMMSSGAVIPLHDIMANSDHSVSPDQFINGAVSYYAAADGKMTAFPFFASTLLLYANKDKLKAVGVSEIPATWEDLEAAMRAMKALGEECPFAHKINAWRDLEQFAAVHNEPIATKRNGFEGMDAEAAFNSDLHVKHTSNLVKWTKDGLMVLQGDLGGLNTKNAFIGEKCAMYFGSTGNYASVQKGAKFNWGVGKVPVYEGHERHNSFIGGNALWVMKGHSDDVYKGIAALFEYLLADEVQKTYVRETGYVPVTRASFSSLKSEGYFKDAATAGLEVAASGLNDKAGPNTAGIRLGFYPQVRKAWQTEVEKAYIGEKSVQQALNDGVDKANELLRRFENTAQ